MLPTISVVIPMFNCETTIEKCLDSIINQMDSIEIICIDDYSKDNTIKILDKYKITNENITVIKHSNNLGTLRSRYDGVMAARGKYIMFADNDDYYLPGAFVDLLNIMDKTDADIVDYIAIKVESKCGFNGKQIESYIAPKYNELKGRAIFDKYLKHEISCVLWSKIFKSSLCKTAYSHIDPVYLTNYEDILAMFILSYYAESYVGIQKKYYVYVPRNESASQCLTDNRKEIMRICTTAAATRQCDNFLSDKKEYEYYHKYIISSPLSMIEYASSKLNNITDKKEKEEMSRLVYENYKQFFSNYDFFIKYIVEGYGKEKYCKESMLYGFKITLNTIISKIRR